MNKLRIYVPKTLSEIWDKLGSMWLSNPTFVDIAGQFPFRNIDTEFYALTESFGVVRKKLGEERYVKLIDLAARAKASFAADPDDKTGESAEGRRLLSEIENVIQEVRARRVAKKEPDDEGRITGD
jgi:hypothetical protein